MKKRTDINDPAVRSVVEKLRSNASVAMLQALGGEFIYDAAAHERARGYAVQLEILPDQRSRFTVVPKP